MLIMSFNVKRFIMFKFGRYKRVINYIKDKKPDIIGFQELTDKSLRLYKKNLDDYNIVGTVGSSKNILLREYCSIFLDKRFKVISEKTYALNRGYCCFCFMTNIGICCVFRITCNPLFYTTRGNDTCRHEGTTRVVTRGCKPTYG